MEEEKVLYIAKISKRFITVLIIELTITALLLLEALIYSPRDTYYLIFCGVLVLITARRLWLYKRYSIVLTNHRVYNGVRSIPLKQIASCDIEHGLLGATLRVSSSNVLSIEFKKCGNAYEFRNNLLNIIHTL